MLRPNEPRVEEVNGSEGAHAFVSAVGAAWLIMGPTQSRRDPHHRACGTGAGRRRGTLQVVVRLYKSCVVELRRGVEAARSDGKSGRKLKSRTWVAWPNGFWRPASVWPWP